MINKFYRVCAHYPMSTCGTKYYKNHEYEGNDKDKAIRVAQELEAENPSCKVEVGLYTLLVPEGERAADTQFIRNIYPYENELIVSKKRRDETAELIVELYSEWLQVEKSKET